MEVEDRLTVGLGVATLAGLGALLYAVLLQLLPAETDQKYWIDFRQPIHGLERNAAVTMRGVKIGRVASITRASDPVFGFVSRVQIDIADRGVAILGDGAPTIREVLDPDLALRPGIEPGDALVAIHTFDARGARTEVRQIQKPAEAVEALARAALVKDGGYALEIERFGAKRLLMFRLADGALGLELDAARADAAVVRAVGAGSPAARSQGLAARDTLRAIRGTAVATVAQAEHVLLTLARTADGESVCAAVFVRGGTERMIALAGRDGAPAVAFWNRGTRATLESNLVTGIKKVELTGDLPLDETGAPTGGIIAPGAAIPSSEADLLAELSAMVSRRLPVLLRRVDQMLIQAGRVGEEAADGLADARGLIGKVDRALEPEGDLGRTLASIRQVADDVRGWTAPRGRIDQLLSDMHVLVAADGNASRLIGEARESLGAISRQVDETLAATRRTLEEGDLKKILANLERITGDGPDSTRKRIDALLTSLDKTVGAFDSQLIANGKLVGLVDQLGYAVRRDLRVALNQIGDGMSVLKQTLIQMQSNPDSLLLGRRGK